LVLTADRPAELHGAGANQTVDQHALYGNAAPCLEFPSDAAQSVWRATVCRAVALASAGPVQVNIPFREPLVPDGDPTWPPGRPDGAPWTAWTTPTVTGPPATDLAPRTVLIVGDPVGRPDMVAAAVRAADRAGWPVIAEPTGTAPGALANGSLLLNSGAVLPRPDEVIVVGRPTLSRGVGACLRSAGRVRVLADGPEWTDPQRLAAEVIGSVDDVPAPDPAWLAGWQAADRVAGVVVDRVLADTPWPTGAHVARDLLAALPADATLFLGSSNPVRYVDLFGRNGNQRIMANRGVAGIDGSVSTAAGIALGSGRPCYALLGDLTFLHDINGLLIGPAEPRPDLTVVVVNDDGGGIFTLLEQGAPEHTASFERMFGTPHGTDLAALCAAHHVPHLLIADRDKFRAALAPAPGPRVLEIRIDRAGLRDWQARLFDAVRAAFTD